jgi:hypothetical protein
VLNYSTNPRLDRYQKELSKTAHTKNVPSEWATPDQRCRAAIKAVGQYGRVIPLRKSGVEYEYRDSAPCTSVVYHNQLWNFAGVVFGFYAGTRLDVSASRQMVSSFSGAI